LWQNWNCLYRWGTKCWWLSAWKTTLIYYPAYHCSRTSHMRTLIFSSTWATSTNWLLSYSAFVANLVEIQSQNLNRVTTLSLSLSLSLSLPERFISCISLVLL
jgi:hypothetical protein